jgi:hypothetical protein
VDSGGTQLYAVGSRSHVTFIDPRQPSSHVAGSVKSVDRDCGVRSLEFNQQLLSIGTGAGHLYFYDMRTNGFLMDNTLKPCFLTASQGWLVSIGFVIITFDCVNSIRRRIRHIKTFLVDYPDHPMRFTLIVTVLSEQRSSQQEDHYHWDCVVIMLLFGCDDVYYPLTISFLSSSHL